MPKTIRIDRVIERPNGVVSVEYTEGMGVLPGPAAGTSVDFPSREAIYAELQAREEDIDERLLLLMALSQWYKGDTQLRTLTGANGRTASLDLTGTGTVVAVR
jgi:hypothetical protein